jgi:hypothetical protein
LDRKKHIVFFSSGISSWAAAKLVAEKKGTRDLILMFMDTNIEDDDNYRFLKEAAANVLGTGPEGGQLIWLTNEEDPFDVFKRKRFMGNSRVDPCSRILKRERADDWISKHFTPDECICYVGIDWTEEHRFTRLAERKLPYVFEAPLIQSTMTKKDTLAWARSELLTPPRMYNMGFQHANCGGFCIKSGQAQFKKLWENFPDRYLEYEKREEDVYASIGKKNPFLRKTIDGKLHYITMREFRQLYLEPGGEVDELDWGGCGCFVDQGDDDGEQEST